MNDIHQTWQLLTCSTPHILDAETVKLLEGRCPRLSMADHRYVSEVFENRLAFPMVHDPTLRLKLLDAALGFSTTIQSLKTFLENTKYLKAMTDAVKTILPKSSKGTIRQTLRRFYVAPQGERFQVQCSENSFKEMQRPDHYGFWSAYRQVFLFAMRHFCGLTEARPLGFTQASRTRCPERSELCQRFRYLVSTLGFALPAHRGKVPQVKSIDSIAIRSLVTRLRPPESFIYTESDISECTARVVSILCLIKPRNVEEEVPAHSCDKFEDWSLQQRCGMTDTDTFFSDRKYLFLENIYSIDQPARENLTSFAVKRDTFRFFFTDFEGNDTELNDVDDRDDMANGVADHEDMGDRETMSDRDDMGDREGDHTMSGLDIEGMIVQTIAPAQPENPINNQLTTVNPMNQMTTVNLNSQITMANPNNQLTTTNSPPSWIVILSQSSQICNCKVELDPQDLDKAIREADRDYKMVIFYNMNLRQAIFVKHEKARLAVRPIQNNGNPVVDPMKENNGNRMWFIMEPDGAGYSVCLVNLPEIFVHSKFIAKELLFICHAEMGNDFSSYIEPNLGDIQGLELPYLKDDGNWEVEQPPL